MKKEGKNEAKDSLVSIAVKEEKSEKTINK